MLTWLRTRPAGTRRAARPAVLQKTANQQVASVASTEDEMPPPFFADDDPAFLDMDESTPSESVETRLARALKALPRFPDRRDPDRVYQLLSIYRGLDRIANAAIEIPAKPVQQD